MFKIDAKDFLPGWISPIYSSLSYFPKICGVNHPDLSIKGIGRL
jgi:hypothetical protein